MRVICNGSRSLSWILAASTLVAAGCKQPATNGPEQQPVAAPAKVQVGGEDAVTLRRQPANNGANPEFLSVTVLPGRGMNVFEVTANLPGKGEVPLLHSPSLEEAASLLNGTGKDEYGILSCTVGGAFLVPYPNRILGKLSPDGGTITTEWQGHTLALPANFPGKKPGQRTVTIHGLILKDKAEDLETQSTADGQTLTGVIHAGNFGGHWLSDTDLHFAIALTGGAVDVTITAKNVGNEPEPMAIGWHPYFNIPSGDRAQARLFVPGTTMAQVNNYDEVFPTGKLRPVKGTVYDYTAPDGAPLDDHFLDDNFSHLQRTHGVVDVRLTDPKSNYGLKIDALSPEIRTVQVYSPPDKTFAAIEEQFNFSDPFGKEWKGMDTGMVTLHPGQSVTWRVRLQLFNPGRAPN